MIFRRKKKEEKVEKAPSTPPAPSPLDLALKFLEEESGEVDIAWYCELEKMPFEPPIVKFIEWVEAKGHGGLYSREQLLDALTRAFRMKLDERRGRR
ncbi:MAG: hypothetical protein DRJ52_04640 [Thermoprotei archaeon]|nr:MAG: hypothetical protein DRJ52_04640 [Thermoprotei archaeon]RLF00737.1 MAG: hypothetical protein DRJ63_01685 [Thermoprotei archaeon]